MVNFVRIYHLIIGVLFKKPLALCDAGDLDGVGSAALFKIRYPSGKIILAYPSEVKNNFIFKKVKWEFVADLPCPGKVKIRADHHETNKPCAEIEFYDPNAPASAVLALKALGLEDNKVAKLIAKYAVETDTAKIYSEEARKLEAAVKGSNYLGRIYIAEKLAKEGLNVLKDNRISKYIQNYEINRKKTEEFASKINVKKETILVFLNDLNLSYRYLSILLEKMGAEFTFIIVPKKYFKIRIYIGAKTESKYNASIIARKFGGGGHQFAAGAILRTFNRRKKINEIIKVVKQFLNKYSLTIYYIFDENNIKTIIH